MYNSVDKNYVLKYLTIELHKNIMENIMTLNDFGKKYLEELKNNQTEFKARDIAMRINKIVYVQTVMPLSVEDKLRIVNSMIQGTTDSNIIKLIQTINDMVR